MALADQRIIRVYRCTNEACEAEMSYIETVSKKWRKACPICKKRSLVLEKANLSISTLVDLNNPKTFGGCSDKNIARREKEGLAPKKETPFWRKGKKINYNILKNPKKYVETGAI